MFNPFTQSSSHPPIMDFIKRFFINLVLVLVLLIILFIISPNIMGQVFQIYGTLFGPIIILILIAITWPRNQRGRRR